MLNKNNNQCMKFLTYPNAIKAIIIIGNDFTKPRRILGYLFQTFIFNTFHIKFKVQCGSTTGKFLEMEENIPKCICVNMLWKTIAVGSEFQ